MSRLPGRKIEPVLPCFSAGTGGLFCQRNLMNLLFGKKVSAKRGFNFIQVFHSDSVLLFVGGLAVPADLVLHEGNALAF